MAKTPSTLNELLGMQEKPSLNEAFFELISEREASPAELQGILHDVACTLLRYREDYIKNNAKELDTVQKIHLTDDLYNLTQICKYTGRLR